MTPLSRPRCVARIPGPALVPECLRLAGVRVFLLPCLLAVWGLADTARAEAPQAAWIKPGAAQSLIIDIAHDRGRWIVVGERGHILLSDDAKSWKQVASPTRVMLTAVALQGGTGYAVGHDATIIQTEDNGATWQEVYHEPEEQAPFLDVVMIDHKRAVAVGAYGLYAETNDGGETWEQSILEPGELEAAGEGVDEGGEEFFYDFHLNDIAIAVSGRWYIAAEAGTIYRSDDDGGSWVRLPSPYEGSFFGVLPLDGDNVLLFGLQGRLFHSDDAGAEWRRIETGVDATLSSGLRLGDGKALIVGYAGIVLNDVDAAAGVKSIRLPNRPALSNAHRLANGDLLTVGESGIRTWSAEVISER